MRRRPGISGTILMRTTFFLRVALVALTLAFTANAQMIPANDRVRVEVLVVSDNDHKDIGKTSADRVTQNRTFTIKLSGKQKSPETRKLKWTAYGRNLKTNAVQPVETGEFKLELAANGQQTVEAKRFSCSYTPEHSEISKSGKGTKSVARAKKVEATGVKYAGYRVQVLDGGTVVGESAEPENIGKPTPGK